jgi:atypical dual specificity phosphatase
MSLYGFSWVIDGKLAAMGRPDCTPADLDELKARGIGALVNLTYRNWPPGLPERGGLSYLQLRIGDFEAPRKDEVDAFVTFCDENIRQGRAVAAHCLAGKGRTGTMIACYLVHRGMDPQEAIDRIRSLRPGSIETDAQEDAVREFAARMRPSTGR